MSGSGRFEPVTRRLKLPPKADTACQIRLHPLQMNARLCLLDYFHLLNRTLFFRLARVTGVPYATAQAVEDCGRVGNSGAFRGIRIGAAVRTNI